MTLNLGDSQNWKPGLDSAGTAGGSQARQCLIQVAPFVGTSSRQLSLSECISQLSFLFLCAWRGKGLVSLVGFSDFLEPLSC